MWSRKEWVDYHNRVAAEKVQEELDREETLYQLSLRRDLACPAWAKFKTFTMYVSMAVVGFFIYHIGKLVYEVFVVGTGTSLL